MQGYVATHGTTPATRKVPYDAIKDFTPIGMIGGTPNVLVVNSSAAGEDARRVHRLREEEPGKLSYGSAGQGSLTHLTMELFKQQIGAFMLHIPYRGIAPAFTDLLGGQTQAMFPGLAAALPHLRSGRVRALAVTGTRAQRAAARTCRRSRSRASRGSMRCSGTARSARRGCPPMIVRQLNETQVAVLQDPDLRERLSVEAVEPMPMTPEQFGRFMRDDIQRWSAIAKAKNIHLDE